MTDNILQELDEGVLVITLNRPQKRNAMNGQLVQEVMATFDAIADNRAIRAVVLSSSA